jgi:Zn finger protein HypA/HybF involved in hydrogenase expression
MVKLTLEEFIEEAVKIHKEKYDYKLVNYINNKTKIEIICNDCKKHFFMEPRNHLSNQGCPFCAGKGKSLDDLLEEAVEVHGDRYDYSYILMYDKKNKRVMIKCRKCKKFFFQTLYHHINRKQNCPFCNGRS